MGRASTRYGGNAFSLNIVLPLTRQSCKGQEGYIDQMILHLVQHMLKMAKYHGPQVGNDELSGGLS